ncbi:MAG: hypothetical protein H0U65_05480 [Rubrobacter sp.]|nr:hypothetical protein [Rubrobacter sp.]
MARSDAVFGRVEAHSWGSHRDVSGDFDASPRSDKPPIMRDFVERKGMEKMKVGGMDVAGAKVVAG